MPRYRADFDVESTVVLGEGQGPFTLDGDSPSFEMTLGNAKPDERGHVPRLSVTVVADSASIDDVATSFRTLLADQLDLLTFATHARFKVERCRRVLEWEPSRNRRAMRIMQNFAPLDPPTPHFPEEVLPTVAAFSRVRLSDHLRLALRSFRLGVLAQYPEEQFQQFWMAIETLAESEKDPTLVPVTCPECGHAVHCPRCDKTPTRRPIAQEAIRALIKGIGVPEPDKMHKRLYAARNSIMHGRSAVRLEKELGRTVTQLMNEAAHVAWYGILRSLPPIDEACFADYGWRFEHQEMVIAMIGEYAHVGDGDHPPEDKLPDAKIDMKTMFHS